MFIGYDGSFCGEDSIIRINDAIIDISFCEAWSGGEAGEGGGTFR
jgi:hypothetical protein